MARTWAPRGQTPLLVHRFGKWRKLSAVSGVALKVRGGRPRSELYFRPHPGRTVRGEQVVEYLGLLGRHTRGRVVVLWDNARQHRGKVVEGFLASHPRFEAVPLPPYCPELNPDEDVWSWVKSKELANLCARDDDDLLEHVEGSLDKMGRRKDLLTACLRDSRLPWGALLNQGRDG